jgi:pseudouridine kinase
MTARFDAKEYGSPDAARVVAVGGANTDLIGFPDADIVYRDSNPGSVERYPGGVARNIAENLARLDLDVHLITAFGSDTASFELAEECREVGVVIEAALFDENLPGARYLAIDDESNELALAVSDMRVIDLLTPSFMAEAARHELLASADVIVVDCNLPAETLEWIAHSTRVPLVVDPTSASKAGRVTDLLNRVAAIKPNGHEAQALVGREVSDLETAGRAALELVEHGCARAFVTPAGKGIGWADSRDGGILTFPPATVIKNSVGAGDAFLAGVVYAMLSGTGTEQAAVMGTACSAIALESVHTVNPRMSRELAFETAKELFS